MRLARLIGAAALAILALTMTPAQAADYKSEYKLSIVVGTDFPWGRGAVIWSDLVRERSGGRIHIKIYPGISLVQGDPTQEFAALRRGDIDMAIGSTINWSAQVKELNLFSLPFLMPDYPAIDALTQGKVGAQLFDILSEEGVVPLAWGENGYRQLSNSVREIKTPEDIKGMKLRVVGSPLYIDIFTALGAHPTQTSWADALPALYSGAIDGQENPLSIFATTKLYEARQHYLSLWNYVADPLVFVVNKDVWESWTPEDQQIVRTAAIEAGQRELMLARKGMTNTDNSLLRSIASHGVKITVLSPDQIHVFAKATQAVFDKWAKQIGLDLVEQAQADIAKR